MKEVRLKCEYCEGSKCDHCNQRGYMEKYGTPEEAIASFSEVAQEIVDDEDGEDFLFEFVLQVSLLEVVDL